MRSGSRKLVLIIALAILVVVAAIGVFLLTRDTAPKSPRVLNEPTDARRIRELRPGPQPGFPVPKLTTEKHGE